MPRQNLRPPFPSALSAVLLALWCAAQLGAASVGAAEMAPLKPIDTSSPRGTLQGFMEFMNEGYRTGYVRLQEYLASPALFPSPEQMASLRDSIRKVRSAERTLDLSGLPPAMAQESALPRAIQLKEILDRLVLPPMDAVPDAQAMSTADFKLWTIPDSEIRIRRMDGGSRAGEYLFSADTVARIPEFYERIKNLPSRPSATAGWYEFASRSPVGVALALHKAVPPRWILHEATWSMGTLLGQPLWRWIGMLAVLGGSVAVVLRSFRLSRRNASGYWMKVLMPMSLVFVTSFAAWACADVLRVTGPLYQVLMLSLWTIFYLALTWSVWVAGAAVAETVIAQERLLTGSIDSQLIRLVIRLVTLIVAVFILVLGADRLGLPAYSVVAGLGVGGLAVALAAQQTLANLLGSLIIMFEKPFTIGHFIRVGSVEGLVEDIGFRSTRIRTFYNSLVTIPSNQLVNSTIDNMELRSCRQVKITLNLTYDTPRERIEAFTAGVRRLLESDPDTGKETIQVMFYDFGPHSLDVLVNFFLTATSRTAELQQRERILLDVLNLADAQGVRFAFPTQTLHVESMPKAEPAVRAAPAGGDAITLAGRGGIPRAYGQSSDEMPG